MARYKVTWTVFKDPKGKTLKGPTFLHGVGDLCSAAGLMGIILVILSIMEEFGTLSIITGVVMTAAGFGLGAVLCRKAKQDAQTAYQKALAEKD